MDLEILEPVELKPDTAQTHVLTPDKVRQVEAWLADGNVQSVETLVKELYDADVAELLEEIDPEQRAQLITLLQPTFDPEIFVYLSADIREEVIQQLDPRQVAELVSELDSDDALDLLTYLEPETRHRILRHLSSTIRAQVEEGLTFPEDSAGRLMQREFVAVPQFWTVGKTLDYLHAGSEDLPEDYYDIYAVDSSGVALGFLPVSRILGATRAVRIQDIMDTDIHAITATTDQEEVAYLFRRYGFVTAPVVNDRGGLLGVITSDDIVHIVEEEASEDILQLSGVNPESDIDQPITRTTWQRFQWLFINLLTEVLVASTINFFQGTIEQLVVLAVLMPIVSGMGGNAGTQTLTVAVRAIATRELTMNNAIKIVFKETFVGGLNGIMLGIITAIAVGVCYHDWPLSGIIGLAMIIELVIAGLSGILIPLGLQKFKLDPAIGSAVILTTITDVVGFFIFLGLASLFLLK